VDRLVATGSENGSAEDVMRLGIGDRQHKSLRFTLFYRAAHVGHPTVANNAWTSSVARLSLGDAGAAERRIDVEGVGWNAIAHAPPLALQEIPSDNLKVAQKVWAKVPRPLQSPSAQMSGALVRSSSSTTM
jgi:hypothetical protein